MLGHYAVILCSESLSSVVCRSRMWFESHTASSSVPSNTLQIKTKVPTTDSNLKICRQ